MQGSKHGERAIGGRAIALLLGATLAVASCQDGYPIPPTPCDTWCDLAAQASGCGFLDPATCVVSCELSHGGSACYAELDDYLLCVKANHLSLTCSFVGPSDEPPPECLLETALRLNACTIAHPSSDPNSNE